jgi:hypothetical protein
MKREPSEVAMPIIEALDQGEDDGVRMIIPEESHLFKVVHK